MRFLLFLNFVCVISIFCISSSSALTTFGKTNSNSNQNPPPPSTPVMVEVVTAISRPSVAFEIARLSSMGRPSGGRSGSKTSHSGHSNMGKGHDCKVDADCVIIQNTTCLSDPTDQKKRCLCSDFSTPYNGHCNNKFKAVGAACTNDAECDDGAECVGNKSAVGKKCQCMEGYYEENNRCNGFNSTLKNSSILLLILALVVTTCVN